MNEQPTRREFLTRAVTVAGVAAAGAVPGLAAAADPYKIFAVVWRGETEVEDGFRDYLTRRGIPFEMTVRNLNLDRNNAPGIVEEIKAARPDLVYTWGTGTTSSIVGKLQTDSPDDFVRDLPGLFVLVAYPVEAGIVDSFENTGRGVTGVSFLASVEVQLNAITAYRPFKKIGVIYDAKAGNSRINVEQLRAAAPAAGMELLELPVPLGADEKSDPESLPGLVAEAAAQGAELLYMGPDSFLARHSDVYTAAAIAAGLPTFAATQAPLKNSRAMFGLVTDYYTLGRLAGTQAEKILVDGIPAQELPVASLARFKLWVNIDVAREVELYPPMDMLAIADFQNSPR